MPTSLLSLVHNFSSSKLFSACFVKNEAQIAKETIIKHGQGHCLAGTVCLERSIRERREGGRHDIEKKAVGKRPNIEEWHTRMLGSTAGNYSFVGKYLK